MRLRDRPLASKVAAVELFLMSPPSRGWALRARANFRSRGAAQVDPAGARAEWLRLAREIQRRGGTVAALPPPSDLLTGMTYAAEAGHVLPHPGGPPRFLLPRMLSPHRQGERARWAELAGAMGMQAVDPGAGVWEGQGDVALFGGAALLFHGGRTDLAGLEAAGRHFEGEVLRVHIREPAFHGNMAVLPLPAVDRLAVCADVLEPESLELLLRRFGEDRLLHLTLDDIRHYATNALPLGRDLLAPSLVPDRALRLFESLGMSVTVLPMTELCEKGGGASRCLVCRAELSDGAVRIPEANRLEAVAREIEAAG